MLVSSPCSSIISAAPREQQSGPRLTCSSQHCEKRVPRRMSHTLGAFRVSTPSNHHTEVGLCQCPAQVQWGWTRSGSSAKAHDTSGLGESPGGRRQTPARRCRRRRHSGRLCWRTPTPQRDSVSEPSATQACAQAKERERARGRSPTSCSQHTRRAPRQLTAVVITPRSTVSTFAAVPSDIPQATSRSDILIYDISSRFPRSHCMRVGDPWSPKHHICAAMGKGGF